MKQLYFALVPFQRRIESAQGFFNFTPVYLPSSVRARWAKPFGYIRQFGELASRLLREQPDVVWMQLPPSFLPGVFLFLRLISRRRFLLIADCHNGTFQPPWGNVPGLVATLNKMDVVLLHNNEVAMATAKLGVDPARTLVLEDPPASFEGVAATAPADGRPTLVVPCSFKADEPISEILGAAALFPEAHFVLTGGNRLSAEELAKLAASAPPNVTFSGYLETNAFNALLVTCTVVVGLTTVEGIQLSVANEAIGAGRPLVLSDTRILRELFGFAALFSANSPQALADCCREAVARADELSARSNALRSERMMRWKAQAREVSRVAGVELCPPEEA